jgi:hypothetical protein
MADAFDPNLPELTGFDFSGLFPPSSGPAPLRAFVGGSDQPPQAPHPGQNLQQLMPLAAILPAILKGGGHVAMAAFLQGLNQAQQQRDQRGQQQFENQRQLSGDQRLNRQEQATEQYRQSELANQRQTQQDAFRQRVITAANNIDSPEQARALLDLLGGESNALGVPRSQVEAYVMQTATPSKLEQKAAQKYIGQLEKTYPGGWVDQVGSAGFKPAGIALPIDPTTGQPRALTLQELLAKAGTDVTTLPTKPKTPKSLQSKSVLLDGKPAEVSYNPETGKFQTSDGTDVSARVKPMPPMSVVYPQTQTEPTLPSWALDASKPSNGPESNVPDKGTGFTPNGLYQASMTYIKTGRFPPTGLGTAPAARAKRDAIINKAGAIAADAGMDIPSMQAIYKANEGSLNKQQQFYDSAQSFLNTADKNAALLDPVLAKIPDTGIPVFNQPVRAFAKSVSGDPNMSQFATYLTSVQNEYGKILNNPNLAGQLTDSARREAQALIDPSATTKQVVASLQALRSEGQNRLISIGDQIRKIQGRLNGTGAGGSAPVPGDNPFRHQP